MDQVTTRTYRSLKRICLLHTNLSVLLLTAQRSIESKTFSDAEEMSAEIIRYQTNKLRLPSVDYLENLKQLLARKEKLNSMQSTKHDDVQQAIWICQDIVDVTTLTKVRAEQDVLPVKHSGLINLFYLFHLIL